MISYNKKCHFYYFREAWIDQCPFVPARKTVRKRLDKNGYGDGMNQKLGRYGAMEMIEAEVLPAKQNV